MSASLLEELCHEPALGLLFSAWCYRECRIEQLQVENAYVLSEIPHANIMPELVARKLDSFERATSETPFSA